jgi:1-acyl-sn-glycerol-3-phosphate acyltransferase
VESAPLRAVSAVLVAGGVGVFPAGTRGDGDVQQVLRGIAYAAGAFGCAGGTGLPATAPARAGVPRPHRPPITVAIGPRLQLPTEAASRRTVAAAADEIHRALAAHTAARRPRPE